MSAGSDGHLDLPADWIDIGLFDYFVVKYSTDRAKHYNDRFESNHLECIKYWLVIEFNFSHFFGKPYYEFRGKVDFDDSAELSLVEYGYEQYDD